MTDRTDYVMVRLSREEQEAIREEAERRGTFVSTFCREILREGLRKLKLIR